MKVSIIMPVYNTGNILICDYATKKLNYDFIYSSSWDKITDEYLILAANDLRPNYYINYDTREY